MTRKFKGLVAALLEQERRESVVDGRSPCIGCGWGCDDVELDLCCDCFDAITMRQILRGVYGPDEQREARESVFAAKAGAL